MKRFLSMLALAVLVLQSVATSAVYATDIASENDGSDSVPVVETAVAGEETDESNGEGVVTDLNDSEAASTEAEEPASDDEETKADVESEEKAEEVSAEAETPVVEELEDPAAIEDETDVVEEIIPLFIPSNALQKRILNVPLLKSSGIDDLESQMILLDISEFENRWNSVSEQECTEIGCVTSAKQQTGSLDSTGDVLIRKVVTPTTHTGIYDISIAVQGKKSSQETITKNSVCAVVVFDKSGSMKDKQGKWNSAVDSAKSFANKLIGINDEALIGLVTFSTRADNTRRLLNENFDNVDFGGAEGGTNLHEGLLYAQDMLNNPQCEGVNKYVVVMSDGEPTYFTNEDGNIQGEGISDDAVCVARHREGIPILGHRVCDKELRPSEVANKQATEIKNGGVTIFSIGYEVDNGGNAERVLKSVASENESGKPYYYPGSANSVAEAFNGISTEIENAEGKNLEVVDNLGDVTLSHGSLTGRAETITESGFAYTFQVKIDPSKVDNATNRGVTLTYIDPFTDEVKTISIAEENTATIKWGPANCGGSLPDANFEKGAETFNQEWTTDENGDDVLSTKDWTLNQDAESLDACEFKCATNYTYNENSNGCELEKFTVTFDSKGGTAVESQTVEYNEKATQPENPEKEGTNEEFDKWILNGSEYNFNTAVVANITLEATYKCVRGYARVEGECKSNTITVDVNDENCKENAKPANSHYKEKTETVSLQEDGTYSLPVCEWECNTDEHYVLNAEKNGCELEKYTVTFDSKGGTEVEAQKVEYNGKATQPSNPTKEGTNEEFDKWMLNESEYNFNTAVVENITLEATYKCAQGYHYEGAEGATVQVCVENDKTELDCSGKIPDNATAIQGHGKVHQTWTDNGWTPTSMERDNGANECGFTCDSGYVYYLSGDEENAEKLCIKISEEVLSLEHCPELPENAHFDNVTETVEWNAEEGKYNEPTCAWSCEANYNKVEITDEVQDGTIFNYDGVVNGIVGANNFPTTNDDAVAENDETNNTETPRVSNFRCEIMTNTVTFDLNGGIVAQGVETVVTVNSGETVKEITTTRNGYNFKEWRLSGSTTTFNFSTPITGDIILVAQWDKVSNGGGGGGGGGGSSTTYECKNLPANAEANNTNKPSRNTDYTYSEEKDGLCTFHCKSGYHPNEDKTVCEKDSTGGNGGGNGDEEIVLGGQVSDKCSVEGSNRSEEEKAAYLYACENDITTIRDINKARLGDFLTRAEMAKMVSVFATKELGMKPNTSKDCSNFAESIANYNQEMKDYMVMSCQLEVMGIHTTNYQAIPDFMPSKRVSRAEFGTILSRVLWGNKYEGTNENYYINHLNALKESNIITNINPNITEYRAWVFLMLYRSVEAIKIARANNNESIEQQVNEELQEEGKAETGLVVEYDSGSVVPDMATLTESGTLATGAVDEIKSGSVVETQTGATTTLTGEDISKEVTGTVVEIGSTND